MESKFEKIRSQINSKLENQRLYAQTLVAIEETIAERNGSLTATTYFAAILTTLQSTELSSELAGALFYLLDDVLPEVPHPVLRSKLNEMMQFLENAYEQHKEEQPVVRSVIGCLRSLLAAQDGTAWSMPIVKKAYQLLLVQSANGSPKARKDAKDAVRFILSHPPPPTVVHPAANTTADFTLRVLQAATKMNQQAAQQILDLLQSIVPYWPPSQFANLCQVLLHLPSFNNVFLTKATFEVFECLFDVQETDIQNDKFASLLQAICAMKPAAVDDRLLPAWLMILSKAFPAYAKIDAGQCAIDVVPVFRVIFEDFKEESRSHGKIANCLCVLVESCIPDSMVELTGQGQATGLSQMVSIAQEGLTVHYQPAWTHIMTVVQALFRRLQRAASPLMNGCVAILGELRLSPVESYKEQLDKTLGVAVATMGPENFLNILPLNLETTNASKDVGRAFLLPLLKSYITNTSLAYFVNVLIPLGDRLAQKAQAAAERELAMQAKVYETLVNQIWSLAPGFCDLPVDLCTAFTDSVAERFSSLLYSQPELRPTIARALQLLIDNNQSLVRSAASDEDLFKAYRITKAQATMNLQYMSKFAVNFLAVFFNVYSQIATSYRGFLGDVIKSYLSVATPEDVNATFKKVLSHLSQALETPSSGPASKDPTLPPPMSHTMLDLAVIMVPFLDAESVQLLYNGTITTLIDKEDEPILQKKGYKVLHYLMACPVGESVIKSHLAELQTRLLEATGSCSASARKDRIKVLLGVVKLLPSSDLHFIPAILSEVVISSKDINEKTRNFSYELLVEMGNKMKEGGTIKMNQLDDMDADMGDAVANIGEYFTMVSAGLAGTTAHMISATINALSRIFFEFKDDLSQDIVVELLQAINVFVGSNNREIVKSALGYIKVCVVILDDSILAPELINVVDGLLKCSHQQRNHHKPKIRHIFERLIRRFSYERISEMVPEEDKKLIANIQKRRLRAKRKKSEGANQDDEQDEMENGPRQSAKNVGGGFHDAYEEVLYGSESELESDDEELEGVKAALAKAQGGQKKRNTGVDTYIRENEAEGPLDLLGRSALAHITSSKPTKRNNKPSAAKSAEYSEDGRLIIKDEDAPSANGPAEDESEEEEDYYLQAQRSADGFVRTEQNKIKFKKTNRKGGNDDEMDVDEDSTTKRKKKIQDRYELIGKEFRSKRAGGDVKHKGNLDPYAYMPLSKVIKKKGRKGDKITFTGRVRR